VAEASGRNRVGYDYFPLADARLDLLEKSPRTAKDLECPHGVQFYDVVIDGKPYPRNAWIYERPSPGNEGGRRSRWLLGRRQGRLNPRSVSAIFSKYRPAGLRHRVDPSARAVALRLACGTD